MRNTTLTIISAAAQYRAAGKTMINTDDGHGWAIVHAEDLRNLGICPSKITNYSYCTGQWFALEEDCDLGTFYQAHVANTGHAPDFTEYHTPGSSVVRSWHRVGVA